LNVLVAPQAFKGSLTAGEVAKAIAAGIPGTAKVTLLPIADGGEGTVDALLSALGGEQHMAVVDNPLGRSIEAGWAMLADGRAAIEMAAASGQRPAPAGAVGAGPAAGLDVRQRTADRRGPGGRGDGDPGGARRLGQQ
jgi:glycerate 2-kinase